MKYILAYDIGTTGVKTCLFTIDKKINLIAGASESYPLYTLANGGAEQDPNDWWRGMEHTTKKVLAEAKVKAKDIEGISFCSQAQGLVLVDKNGHHLRRAMSYMDQRSGEELKKGISYGLQIAGANLHKLLVSVAITGAVSSSVKDPLWKYKWVEAHEPHIFKKVYKWLDVKEYLITRTTGNFVSTYDDAYSTFLFDNRPKKMCWSERLCKLFNVNMDHLPKVVSSTACVGTLTEKAAKELGLVKGIKVFGGGSDASLIGVGAGATEVGDTHIYCGTSGWVSTVVNKRMVDANSMIAAIQGAEDNKYNYFAEMETAGKCLEWVRDHMARDEIVLYLHAHREYKTYEDKSKALFVYLNEKVKKVPPGANGVIFTPWLHGNRCPFENPKAAGTFFGVKLENGKTDMIRAVLEGIYYHIRWMAECEEKKVKIADSIRFVGGGAISPISCQMLANILGKKVETVAAPQNVGAVGAAAVAGVGLGYIPNLSSVKKFIPVAKTYEPEMAIHKLFDPNYFVFKKLHKANKKNYVELHDKSAKDKSKAHAERMRLLKFILFSFSAGAIQFCTNWIMISIWDPNKPGLEFMASVSYIIPLVISVIWNFTFNRKFTFKSATNVPKSMALAFLFYVFFAPASLFLQAFLVNGIVLSESVLVIPCLKDLCGWAMPELLATIICMLLNFALEFLWQRYVVFRNSIDSNKNNNKK